MPGQKRCAVAAKKVFAAAFVISSLVLPVSVTSCPGFITAASFGIQSRIAKTGTASTTTSEFAAEASVFS